MELVLEDFIWNSRACKLSTSIKMNFLCLRSLSYLPTTFDVYFQRDAMKPTLIFNKVSHASHDISHSSSNNPDVSSIRNGSPPWSISSLPTLYINQQDKNKNVYHFFVSFSRFLVFSFSLCFSIFPLVSCFSVMPMLLYLVKSPGISIGIFLASLIGILLFGFSLLLVLVKSS